MKKQYELFLVAVLWFFVLILRWNEWYMLMCRRFVVIPAALLKITNYVAIDLLKYRFISIIKGFCPPAFRGAFLFANYPIFPVVHTLPYN